MELLERKVYCIKCNRETNHFILLTHKENSEYDADYQWELQRHIVKCAGCDETAFVEQFSNEDSWEYVNGEQVWKDVYLTFPEKPIITETPRYWVEKQSFNNIPESIDQLYLQVIDVYNKGYFLLAMIGIRTIIEAICLDVGIESGILRDEYKEIKLNKKNKPITSDSLEGKIFGLYEQGMIIWDQTLILQKIRDYGNAAVHEIKSPSITILKSAIQIVEQLLNNVYELKVHKLLKK